VRRKPHGGIGRIHGKVVQPELLKMGKNCQFPDEFEKIEGSQIHF
jgi:hypothetical protein